MRLSGVARLGLDEHAWQRADAHRHTQFVTGIVTLPCGVGRPARLLDIVPGRSGTVLGHRLAVHLGRRQA
jgi:transposase